MMYRKLLAEFQKLPFGERKYIIDSGQLKEYLDGIETFFELQEFIVLLEDKHNRMMRIGKYKTWQ
jgi:hypothetical protein